MHAEQPFTVTSGTVTGREHDRLEKNNQDGIGIAVQDGIVAAVVTDGCSEGGSSEVGAKLAAQWLATWAPLYARATDFRADRFVPGLARGLLRHLGPFARGLSTAQGIDPAVVQEFFLFTFLMVVMTEKRAIIFGLGDGLFAIDGETRLLDPGEGNAPDYVGYGLLEGTPVPIPIIHADIPAPSALLLATDGAASMDLREFACSPRYVKNPSLLHKRLRILKSQLQDDTTAVLIRRRRCA